MNEEVFVREHIEDWRRLRALCHQAGHSASSLSPQDLQEFVRLYRKASRDLSLARTRSSNAAMVEHLNQLVTAAYSVMYEAPRPALSQGIYHVVANAAQTVRRRSRFVWAAALLFMGAILFGAGIAGMRPEVRDVIVPEGFLSSFEMWKTGAFDERTAGEGLMATGFYASNNPRASIFVAAIGAGTLGLGSVYFIATNGMLFGVLVSEVTPLGHLDFLLSSVAPHGVPEIFGLFLSGAAGLLLGSAIICPGRRTRSQALRERGKDAVTLIATSVVLMFIAAPIEGFFSFNPMVPGFAKVLFATLSAVAWALFWMRFGHPKEIKTRER